MRKSAIVLGVMIVTLFLAACGDEPPPTQIVVVTATPPPGAVPDGVVSPEATLDPMDTAAPLPTDSLEPSDTPPDPTEPSALPATDTLVPMPTAPNPLLPTNVYAEVQIAEQVFERGRMMWLRHNRQIWVTMQAGDDPTRGDWFCYNDTFEEGEPEIDPDLIPPEGLFQPRRGFGKLWRELSGIREGVGWATTTEFELTSTYTYIAGGLPDDDDVLPPGEHRLTTLYNETIIFYEQEMRGDCTGGLWRMSQ